MEVVREVIEDELHLDIPIAGLAKDRKHRTVSVRGSVEKVYEREEKGDEICRQFPGGWPVWKICGITMRGRTISSL